MTGFFWILLTLLVILGWIRVRERLRRKREDAASTLLDDDDIRRIEREGRLPAEEEEPLDYDEIEEEERRFWGESWDEPEPW